MKAMMKCVVAGMSEDEFNSRGKLLLASDNFDSKKTVDTAELSDLAIDMRHRLQKELAQRAVNRVSLSHQSEADSVNESQGVNVENELLPSFPLPVDSFQFVSKGTKVATDCNGSVKLSDHNACGHTEEIAENQTFKVDKTEDSLVLSEVSCLKTFQNPFDHLKLDNESAGKMAAMMLDLSAEDFIPGDKCEEKLAADECAWKKENIPPAVGPTGAVTSNLDFSGIVGNAEISLHSVDVSQYGHQKKRVSVGEFFRLKSEQLHELGSKSNIGTYFGMKAQSPEKSLKLLPLVELEVDDVAQEVSVRNQDCTKQTERTHKPLSFSKGKESSLYSSEESINPRDSLSLSCIADILAKVDTCASPHTVVSNILKQSGLCNPKGILPVKRASTPQTSHVRFTSDACAAGDGVLKDASNFGIANVYSGSKKEDIACLSRSKYDTEASVSVIDTCDPAGKGIHDVQNVVPHTVINLPYDSDKKGKLSGSNVSSLSSDGGVTVVSEGSSDGWVFSVPNASIGIGAKLCSSSLKTSQKSNAAKTLNQKDKVNDQTFTLEDSISAGDLNALNLTSLAKTKQLDESLLRLTQEPTHMPKESVDCSALVPTLKQKYSELWPQLSMFSVKDPRTVRKPEWDLSVHSVESDHEVPRTPPEGRISAQSMMSTSHTAVAGKLYLVRLNMHQLSIQFALYC
jgi:hypothetical protein